MKDVLKDALKHLQEGRLGEAETYFKKILVTDPEYPDALHYLGVIALQKGDSPAAVCLIERSLAHEPANAVACSNLGLAFADLGRWQDAEKAYRTALKGYPCDPEILANLGEALARNSRYEEAVSHFRQALEVVPDDPIILTNLGNALQAVGKANKALAAYENAISVQPDMAETHFNLGMALYDQERLEESITAYRNSLVLEPDNVAAHHHLGRSLFLLGRYREGWEEYEWRWQSEKDFDSNFFPQTLWQGNEVKGNTILVWSEQGVGDEILFAGMIPELVERGAKVVLECDPRLVPLFERSLSGVECLAKERPLSSESLLRDIDLQVPGGGLGQWLRPNSDSFHRRPYYLVPDEGRRDRLRDRYQDSGNEFLVGISWDSKNKQMGDLKSIPLDSFLPLVKIPGITFVDLQYGDTKKERRNFEDKTGVSLIGPVKPTTEGSQAAS